VAGVAAYTGTVGAQGTRKPRCVVQGDRKTRTRSNKRSPDQFRAPRWKVLGVVLNAALQTGAFPVLEAHRQVLVGEEAVSCEKSGRTRRRELRWDIDGEVRRT
jgi:hypothetical protein